MIQQATYIADYKIKIVMENGLVKTIDFLPAIQERSIFKRFLKIDRFKKFKFTPFHIEWPGNIMDFHYTQLLKM